MTIFPSQDKKKVVFNLQHCMLKHMEIWTQYKFEQYGNENVIMFWFGSKLPSEKNTTFTCGISYVSKLHFYFSKLIFEAKVVWY